MARSFDVLIIGAGPGGYVAAIRAAQLGLKTAIVERAELGGVCLNWGCIPTKALLRSAEVYRQMNHAEEFGLAASSTGFDLSAVVERSRAVAERLNRGVGFLLKKNKVTVLKGSAVITEPGRLRVSGEDEGPCEADHVIIATGARPRVLPGLEPDGEKVWTYFDALKPQAMPESLLVVGSGAIGIEFASFYATFGADVTVVEIAPQILPAEDAEIAGIARKQLEKSGVKFIAPARVAGLEKDADSVTATIVGEDGTRREITVERVISAVGVVGNTEGLGLEDLGVKTEGGCIAVDGLGRTSVPGLHAIGDVAGPPMLAHKASHEGIVCVEAIAGLDPSPIERGRIPACTYCHPQIASVGLSEAAAIDAGHQVRVGRFPFAGNGKAIALGEAEGLVKTVFDAGTGQLLGAHMVGAEVTELIQGFVVAMNLETTEEELMHTVFAHPTLSEMMHESVLDAWGRAIHV